MAMIMTTNVMVIAIMITNWKKKSVALLALSLSFATAGEFWQERNEQHGQSHLPLADVVINDKTIQVELATTPRTQAYGLMNRFILPENQGMLFVFEKTQPLSFWMKNTKIPLDILYFDAEGTLVDFAEAMPCLNDPCPSYPSKAQGKYVLEIGKGERKRLGIEIGDQLKKVD